MCSAAQSRPAQHNYVNYLLPGILLIAIASGISYTAYRLFLDMQQGIFERFHSMPIARSTVLWGHVLTSVVSNAHVGYHHHSRSTDYGLSLVGGNTAVACRSRYTRAVYTGLDVDCGDCRVIRKIGGRCERLFLSDHLPTVYQLGLCANRFHAGACSRLCRKSASHLHRRCDTFSARGAACRS